MQPQRPVTSEFVDAIFIGSRLRALDPARVQTLAQSIERHGLLSPITVVYGETELEDGSFSEGPILVAGLHRLKAVELLRHECIDCYAIQADEIEREMLEISENLHRLDLTKEERDRQVRRYAELLEVTKQNSGSECATIPRGPGMPKGIASQIAAETGLSKATVNRILSDDPETPKPKVSAELAKRRAQDHADQNDAKDEAERAAANILAEHVPGEHWAALLSYLDIGSAKSIAKHFRTLNGAVFDNTRAAA